jgi:cell division protein FtsI/penicillin-binding protein 2
MKENKKIIEVLIAICSLFFILVGYLTYIQVFKSKEIVQNTYNRRQYQADENTTRGLTLTVGYLILGWVSRLDAFSVYPFRTWLPSYALGSTTGTPEVRPSRSSRTKDRSLQISCARDR